MANHQDRAFDDLRNTHKELFPGKTLNMRETIEGALSSGMKLQEYYDSQHKPGEKRAELAASKRKEEDESLTKATEGRIRSEMASEGYALPGGASSNRPGSPLLAQFKAGDFTPDEK